MRDLSDVDRQLQQLGAVPGPVNQLLDQVLGSDRSLARLDQLLAELGQAAGAPAPRVFVPPPPMAAESAADNEPEIEDAPLMLAAATATALEEDTVVDRAPVD